MSTVFSDPENFLAPVARSSTSKSTTHRRIAAILAPLVALTGIALAASSATAQYASFDPMYGTADPSTDPAASDAMEGPAPTPSEDANAIDPAVQDAIDEAADELYEDLFAELSEEVALVRSCSIVLDPADPVGSSCSCTANGPGPIRCDRNVRPNGTLINVTCRDNTGVTACAYTGPAGNRKRSCGCR